MNKDKFLEVVLSNLFLHKIIFDNVRFGCYSCNNNNSSNNKKNKKKHYKWEDVVDSARLLAGYGYLSQLKQYYDRYPFPSSFTNTSFIKRFFSNDVHHRPDRMFRVFECMIMRNQLHIMKYFFEDLRVRTDTTGNRLLLHAIKLNRVEIIRYIMMKFKDVKWDYTSLINNAPLSKNIDLLNLISSDIKINNNNNNNSNNNNIYANHILHTLGLENAALVGNIEMIEWFLTTFSIKLKNTLSVILHIEFRHPQHHEMYEKAIIGNHFNVIEYLVNNRIEFFSSTLQLLDFAVRYNRFEILKYLHNQEELKTLASPNLLDLASNSDLEMVVWLFENRTEHCTKDLHSNAALNGRLDILQLLHNRGIEGFTTQTMDSAAKGQHLDIVKWLHENRTEGCTTKAMDRANDLAIIRYLHEHRTEGCTTKAMDRSTSLEITKWLHENRTEGCTTKAMDYASSLEILKWLHEHRTEGCTTRAMNDAALRGDIETLIWLRDNRTEGDPFEAFLLTMNTNIYTTKWFLTHYKEQFVAFPPLVKDILKVLVDRKPSKKNIELFKWFLNELPYQSIVDFKSDLKWKKQTYVFYLNFIDKFIDDYNKF